METEGLASRLPGLLAGPSFSGRAACTFTLGAALIGAAALVPQQANAQTLDDDYWISVMAFYPRIDTDVRVQTTNQSNVGTDIDLEKDLKLDNDEILPSVTAGGRFGKVIIGADFYKLKRQGSVALDREIDFDGVTYPVNAQVESEFDTDIYRLTIGYAFVQNDSVELGAALGVHATTFDLSLAGEGTANGQTYTTQVRRRDFLAPLPTVGAFVTYKVAPSVELNGRIDWLSLKVGDYDGRLINAQAGINYKFAKNFAVGVAYRYVDYRVEVEKDLWEGRVQYKLKGPAALLQVSF